MKFHCWLKIACSASGYLAFSGERRIAGPSYNVQMSDTLSLWCLRFPRIIQKVYCALELGSVVCIEFHPGSQPGTNETVRAAHSREWFLDSRLCLFQRKEVRYCANLSSIYLRAVLMLTQSTCEWKGNKTAVTWLRRKNRVTCQHFSCSKQSLLVLYTKTITV